MTEEEAKTKWCPMARVGFENLFEREKLTGIGYSPYCIGARCMLWRKEYIWSEYTGRGYCGLGGKP